MTEVSILDGGVPGISSAVRLGSHSFDVPAVDVSIAEIGGASIAWSGKDGNLFVGPRNSGSDPGPMCFGKGASEPTVTDALLFLGYLPESVAGTGLIFSRERAEDGIGAIARKLEVSPQEAAEKIIEVAAREQARVVHQKTVRVGEDPRDYALMAIGGAGPLMAAKMAKLLGIKRVIVPPFSGCGGASGLAGATMPYELMEPFSVEFDGAALEVLHNRLGDMMAKAEAALTAQKIPKDAQSVECSIELRGRKDNRVVTVELSREDPLSDTLDGIADKYRSAFRDRYGLNHDDRIAVDVVNLRLIVTCPPHVGPC
jgi:N-methylhydantoinase A